MEGEVYMNKSRKYRSLSAHLAKNSREDVDEFHNGVEALDKLPILVSISLELVPILCE